MHPDGLNSAKGRSEIETKDTTSNSRGKLWRSEQLAEYP
jgi:hypothetical protein